MLTSCAIPMYSVPKAASAISTWVSITPAAARHTDSTSWGMPSRTRDALSVAVCRVLAQTGASCCTAEMLRMRDAV